MRAGESCISIPYRICLEIRDGANSGIALRFEARGTRLRAHIKERGVALLRMYAPRPQTWEIKNLEIRRLHVNRVSVIYFTAPSAPLPPLALSLFLSSLPSVSRQNDDERRKSNRFNWKLRKAEKKLEFITFHIYQISLNVFIRFKEGKDTNLTLRISASLLYLLDAGKAIFSKSFN